jgi:hypothetical protein
MMSVELLTLVVFVIIVVASYATFAYFVRRETQQAELGTATQIVIFLAAMSVPGMILFVIRGLLWLFTLIFVA